MTGIANTSASPQTPGRISEPMLRQPSAKIQGRLCPHLTSSCVAQRRAAIPLFRAEEIPYRPILHSAGLDPSQRA